MSNGVNSFAAFVKRLITGLCMQVQHAFMSTFRTQTQYVEHAIC